MSVRGMNCFTYFPGTVSWSSQCQVWNSSTRGSLRSQVQVSIRVARAHMSSRDLSVRRSVMKACKTPGCRPRMYVRVTSGSA